MGSFRKGLRTVSVHSVENNFDFDIIFASLILLIILFTCKHCLCPKKKVQKYAAVSVQPKVWSPGDPVLPDVAIPMPPIPPSTQIVNSELPRHYMIYTKQSPNNPYYPQLELNAYEAEYINNSSFDRGYNNRTVYGQQPMYPSAPVMQHNASIHNI